MIISLPTHPDLLNALLIALRDAVRRHRFRPEHVENIMSTAKDSTPKQVRIMLEYVLEQTR